MPQTGAFVNVNGKRFPRDRFGPEVLNVTDKLILCEKFSYLDP